MFMLNLLFDFTVATGLFSENADRNHPLLSSKHWLHMPAKDGGGADPEAEANWRDLTQIGTLYIPHGGNPANTHHIAIRIAPVSTAPINPNSKLDLVVAFGRPVIARQQLASPFMSNNTAITMFQWSGVVRTGGKPGWFFPLDKIAGQPDDPLLTFRYEFAVGVTVTDPATGIFRTYGEDPEFDIGT